MRGTQNNGGTFLSDASVGNADNTSINRKEAKAPEAQMDIDFSEDDLLGEENDLGEAAHDFVGVKKGHSVNVRSATSLTSSAPARLLQRSLQLVRPGGKPATSAMVAAIVEGGSKGQTLQPTMGLTTQTVDANQNLGKMSTSATLVAALDPQENFKQSSIVNDDEQMEVSVGQLDGAAGEVADGAQHLGALLDAMIEAGVTADGGSKKELGSVMTMAIPSDGELTLVRRSKRNAVVADVDSLEKAEKRVAIKNLEETQGKANVNSVCSFSNVRFEQNLGEVGISLGDKENIILGSVALIKDVERDRLKPTNSFNKLEKETDIEEDEIDPDISTLSRRWTIIVRTLMEYM